MQLNKVADTAEDMANIIADMLDEYFGNRIDDMGIDNLRDEPYMEFRISFVAYNYFPIYFNYDRGSFGCCIATGDLGIDLKSSQEWYDTADMDIFYKEIKEQIELRIPDKFLIAKGWK